MVTWDVRDIEVAALRAEIKGLRKDLEQTEGLRTEVAAVRTTYSDLRRSHEVLQKSAGRLLKENLELHAALGSDGPWANRNGRQ